MRQFKGVIIVLVGLFIMITLVSLLMPSKVMTVRSVVIHADPGYVISEINDLKKWKDWHPVFMNDKSDIAISDPSTGVNAFATWNANDKQNKLLITENGADHIKASLIRENENDIINIISIKPVAGSITPAIEVEWWSLTKVKWYPWEKFAGIFIDKMTGPGYELALNNLKQVAEDKK